ncbi:MAG: STAS domain-containing protein [Planctomycetes bacterium]|nr:STAS domain-containing protein [Planctomycetota bacterium]
MNERETAILAGEYQIINASGSLNGRSSESQELKSVLNRAGDSLIQGNYIINLSDVDYIDSSTMGMFVRFLYQLQAAEKKLVLLSPPESISEVLRMTGLQELMPIADTEEQACELLGVERRRLAGKSEDVNYAQLEKELEELIICSGESGSQKESPQLQKILGR